MEELTPQLEKFLINYHANMPALMGKFGLMNRTNGNCFCPFHENKNTPAAHLYHDELGWCLWCFAEHRLYTPYDLYKQYSDLNTKDIANAIWNSLSAVQRDKLIQLSGTERDIKELPFKKELNDFRKHKLNYNNLLDTLLEKGEL